MNHAYRLVWNDRDQGFVPAPETAKARGKRGRQKLLVASLAALGVISAQAAPVGGQVAAGSGSISQSGSLTTISQSSQNLSLNWQKFGIAAGETVRFEQPNASAIALNRVLGNEQSQIFGSLQANGQVFLINSNGVLFGKTAQVDVGGLVATTLNISDADFMAGNYRFAGNGGSIRNQGAINAPGGYVALLGGQVSNEGTITARLGTVALAAGNAVNLSFAGNKLVDIQVSEGAVQALAENRQLIQADGGNVILTAAGQSALLDAVVNNTGVIEARTLSNQNGVVRLLGDNTTNTGSASATTISVTGNNSVFLDKGSTLSGNVIDVTAPSITGQGNVAATGNGATVSIAGDYVSLAGTISANNAAGSGGTVSITGADALLLSNLSSVTANGTTGGDISLISARGFTLVSAQVSATGSAGKGGKIDVSAAGSTTLLGASLDASGKTGGGRVRIGGDPGASDLIAANQITLDAATSVNADATGSGNGGRIGLWSTAATNFYGTLSAHGGQVAGNGGTVDLSSGGVVNQTQGAAGNIKVSARAAGYANGNIIEDPANVVIGDAIQSFDIWKALVTTSGNLDASAAAPLLASNSSFGRSVALNSSYALIGAAGVASNRGNAYLYNLGTGVWTDLATTSGQPVTGLSATSQFGVSVAINSNYALVGANGVSSFRGDAYLYNLASGVWTDLGATSGQPITASAGFGLSVALNANFALIGATGVSSNRGDAYLYNLGTGAWTDLAITSGQPVTGLPSASQFGYNVSLNGSYALVGAPNVSSQRGNAYLYNLGSGAWTDLAATSGQPVTSLAASSFVGSSVALNSSYALIGAWGVSSRRGNAYLYNLRSEAWTDLATTSGQPVTALASSSQFGYSTALNSSHALIGAFGAASSRGDAYLYNLGTGAWTDLAATSGQPVTGLLGGDYFGTAVALNSNYALIGALGTPSGRGNAYLYNLSGGWTDLGVGSSQPITGLAGGSQFGTSVTLNGNYALVGAAGVSSYRGDAYLYNLGTGAWTDLATTAGQPVSGLAGNSNFGYSVALNSNYALVGAYGAASGRGNAYLYNLGSGAWTDMATTSGQPVTGLGVSSYFGNSVALNSSYALIGVTGFGGSDRGNAYLYNLGSGTWMDLATTPGQPVTGLAVASRFGTSVALNSNYALIGAGGVLANRGDAYLYNLGTGAWTDMATTSGQPVTGMAVFSYFGNGVALNNSYALIGASGLGSSRGNAYLYNLGTGAWTDLATTAGQPVTGLGASSQFGSSVALNSSSVLVGAYGVSSNRGNAYLYDLGSGAWTDLASSSGEPVTGLANGSRFGWGVALNSNYALVGALGVSSSRGNAYLYNLGSGAWTDLATASGPAVTNVGSNAYFGSAVALNSNYALVGALGVSGQRGDAYVYNLGTGAWTDLATTSGQPVTGLGGNSRFGASVALNSDYALVGAYGVSGSRGDAYLYNLGNGAWTDLATTSGQPVTGLGGGSTFGSSVALNSNFALVGGIGVLGYRGDAWLYNLGSGAWTDLAATSGQPITGLASGSYFGVSAALNNTDALIGAFGDSSNRGNAYLYNLGSGAWTNLATTSGQPVTGLGINSQFGMSVALNSSYALVGALGVSGYRGNAWLYNLGSGVWSDLTMTSGQPVTGLSNYSHFGVSVALNGSYALIGASGVSSDRGDAYLYNLDSGVWTDLATTSGQPVTGLGSNSAFGGSVALNSNYALIGAQGVSSNRGNAYLAFLPRVADNVSYVTPETIAANLSSGNYTLTADNNLTIAVPFALSPVNTGNSLALVAGNSININAATDFGGRSTSLIANAPSASLGNASNRLAGAAGINVASGATLTDTGANLTLEITPQALSGRDTTYGATGPLAVAANVTAGNLVLKSEDADINVSSTLSTTGTGSSLILDGWSIGVGAATLSAPNGRWLIYDPQTTSAATTSVTLGSNTASFTRFSCTYTGGCANGAVIPGSGNGLIYGWAPELNISGVTVSNKVYDATTNATLGGTPLMSGVVSSGTITADVSGVTLDSSGASGSFASKDANSGISVTFSGYALSNNTYGYVLQQPGALSADISRKALTQSGLSVPVSKVYDATTAAVVSGTAALASAEAAGAGTTSDGKPYSGDTVSITGTAAGTYNSKDVATANTVTFSGLSLTGPQSGNYSLTVQSPQAATITAKPVTSSGLSVAASKVYDATTAATLIGTATLFSEAVGAGNSADNRIYTGDAVSLTGTATGTYNSKDAATASSVSFGGLSLTGADSGNYSLTMQGPQAAGIARKPVTSSGLSVAASKVYDATTAATLIGSATLTSEAVGAGNASDNKVYAGDTVSVTGAAGTYNSKNVAEASSVIFTGSLTGADSSNYYLTMQGPQAATITAKPVTESGLSVAASKVYDATSSATLIGTATLTSEAVGAGNASDNKVYAGDTVSVTGAAGSYNSKNVATASSVTFTGSLVGADAGNYSLTMQGPQAATITAKPITESGLSVAASKVYDASTGATLIGTANLTNGAATAVDNKFYTGDTVSVTGAAGSYNSKNVATASSVTFSGSLTGADAGNYSLTMQGPQAATITAKPVTSSGLSVAASKVYDATTNATLIPSVPTLTSEAVGAGSASDNKIYAGDVVSVGGTWTATYNSKNVATGSSVSFSGLSLIGADAGNYSLTMPSPQAATITAKPVTASGLSVAASKVYDATTNATLIGSATLTSEAVGAGNAVDNKVYAGDTVSVTGAAGSYNSKNVATASSVSFTGSLTGADSGNYSLTMQGPQAATITAKELQATGLTAGNKIYNAALDVHVYTALATISGGAAFYTDGKYYTGDNVILNTAGATGTFGSKTVGTTKDVTISGLTLTGTDAGNYTVIDRSGAVADITAKQITVSGLTASSKVYDADPTAGLNVGMAAITGGAASALDNKYYTGDAVTLDMTGASAVFANKNVGNGKAVTVVAGVTLAGADAGNYSLVQPTGLTANITPASLTVTGATAQNKAYDATLAASITGSLAGVLGSDSVSLSGGGSFGSADVGNAKPVTASLGLGGTDAGNYLLTQPAGLSANITQATLTIAANNASKIKGNPNPPLGVSYSGFGVGEGVGNLITPPTVSTTAVTDSPVGSYAITASGANAGPNYVVQYLAGLLTVNPVSLATSSPGYQGVLGSLAGMLSGGGAGGGTGGGGAGGAGGGFGSGGGFGGSGGSLGPGGLGGALAQLGLTGGGGSSGQGGNAGNSGQGGGASGQGGASGSGQGGGQTGGGSGRLSLAGGSVGGFIPPNLLSLLRLMQIEGHGIRLPSGLTIDDL
jgi:filamentous hemagglutinin family protein